MPGMTLSGLGEAYRLYGPGVIASAIVAAAATFLSEHYQAPVMLMALLLGMAVGFLADADSRTKAGIEFTARHILRFGVALLGLRITLEQILALGWSPLLMVVGSVVLTILLSVLLARLFGFTWMFGMLTGGATAICGASAALALSAALPANERKEQATLFTVIGVSALSTLAMILYPTIARSLGLDPAAAGIFLGGTIHDVAQVVGAGYSMGPETGDTATVVKLMRVAMLVPVIFCAALLTRASRTAGDAQKTPLLPGFAVAFVLLAAVNSSGWLPPALPELGSDLSKVCLVSAIAALGMKTRLQELVRVGLRPILLMVLESALLVGLVIGFLRFSS
ncbi:YeiH family protein [Pseudomonas sp. N040]|uniref:YeiH family protein n=1 Tax=Pseudomonas sp. N040 TaxID=2785325 RepID=UPI0018A2B3AC|nr:putative sulfate exporter family transporter [Pseudomonas sp. N040]MBF7731171.1 putative sulfate exporter family transporter [Pseudomonas sp. N040]MBW7014814.1 putative sulfate exporter family transporter [Pseudomonas sp. N040]